MSLQVLDTKAEAGGEEINLIVVIYVSGKNGQHKCKVHTDCIQYTKHTHI